MKVTIDTKEDSYEDIKKVLHILTNILEQKSGSIPEISSNADTGNMMDMFNSAPDPTLTAEKAPDFGSFLNLVNKKEEIRKDIPRIEVF